MEDTVGEKCVDDEDLASIVEGTGACSDESLCEGEAIGGRHIV